MTGHRKPIERRGCGSEQTDPADSLAENTAESPRDDCCLWILAPREVTLQRLQPQRLLRIAIGICHRFQNECQPYSDEHRKQGRKYHDHAAHWLGFSVRLDRFVQYLNYG